MDSTVNKTLRYVETAVIIVISADRSAMPSDNDLFTKSWRDAVNPSYPKFKAPKRIKIMSDELRSALL
ncbi:hypothetical protein SDC9_72163 [bioreactor metagenome]|uniref:Uncharacterized protein n=1 Tax=bioreactor metagenome TaxID=1076179 RepID=A0A644YAU3_9ZZZZ